MSAFTNECWDAVTISGYLTRALIPGVAEGCADIDAVLELWQRGENFVIAALRNSGDLGLTQNYGDAGLNAAMDRFDRKYSTPKMRGLYVWQDPDNIDFTTGKLNEYANGTILSAKVDSLGHCVRALGYAKQQGNATVVSSLNGACACFAKALTMGKHSPEVIYATLRVNYPDVCDAYGLSNIRAAHDSAAPELRLSSIANSGGGCYVATAVYGSYDCPEVWTLRRFRDFRLAKSSCGRAFIRVYYRISPMLVARYGQTSWFKRICKKPLDRLVRHCRGNGLKDTPYIDKAW